jgi:hypothetical protein
MSDFSLTRVYYTVHTQLSMRNDFVLLAATAESTLGTPSVPISSPFTPAQIPTPFCSRS